MAGDKRGFFFFKEQKSIKKLARLRMFESSGRVAKRREGHPSNEGVSSCTLGHREREDSVQWGLRPDLEEQQTASFLLHNTALVLIFDSASGWKTPALLPQALLLLLLLFYMVCCILHGHRFRLDGRDAVIFATLVSLFF